MTGSLPGPAPDDRPQPNGQRDANGVRSEAGFTPDTTPRRTVVSALVEHEPGVLAEVSTLFARRQFNIESLTVGPTDEPGLARITVVVEESAAGVEQAEKQLGKLLPVVAVRELAPDAVERELVLCKVDGDEPEKVRAITEMYGGRTLDAGPRTITVELTGDAATVEDALDAFRQFGIREIARTGGAALARGEEPTAATDEDSMTAADETPAEPADGRRTDGESADGKSMAPTDEESVDGKPTDDAAGRSGEQP